MREKNKALISLGFFLLRWSFKFLYMGLFKGVQEIDTSLKQAMVELDNLW